MGLTLAEYQRHGAERNLSNPEESKHSEDIPIAAPDGVYTHHHNDWLEEMVSRRMVFVREGEIVLSPTFRGDNGCHSIVLKSQYDLGDILETNARVPPPSNLTKLWHAILKDIQVY